MSRESVPRIVLSPFQKKKLTRKFQILDVDGNGLIEWNDFARILEQVVQQRQLTPDSRRARELDQTNRRLWSTLAQNCDVDGDGSISLEEWLGFHQAALEYELEMLESLPGQESAIDATASFIFELLDYRGVGRVSEQDYQVFCEAYGIEPSGFAKLDRNGDGFLSRDEVVTLVVEFFCSNDPQSPGNWFFGDLS